MASNPNDILERLYGTDYRPEEAQEEIRQLRRALVAADKAMNPPDKGGISMHEWNKRLKEATRLVRAVLGRWNRTLAQD